MAIRTGLAFFCFVVFACGGSEKSQVNGFSTQTESERFLNENVPPGELTDVFGRTWIRSPGPVDYADESMFDELAEADEASDLYEGEPEDLTTIAHELQSKTLINGYEYVLAEPDFITAEKILAGDYDHCGSAPDYGEVGYDPSGDVPPEELVGQRVFIPDDRYAQTQNTSYPVRTIAVITTPSLAGRCTGTMIGPSTMISAAHCFHNGTKWYSPRSWGLGAYGAGAHPYPYNPWGTGSYPAAAGSLIHGCYVVTIPGGWNSARKTRHDYSVSSSQTFFRRSQTAICARAIQLAGSEFGPRQRA